MMVAAELELVGQLQLVFKKLKWWLLVAASAGALLLALVMQQKPMQAQASGQFSLSSARVKLLANDYQQIAANTQLFIGALEVDELARLALSLDSDVLWQQVFQSDVVCQQAKVLCTEPNQSLNQVQRDVQRQFHFEQKRRGNLLVMQLSHADSITAKVLLEQVVVALTALDQQQHLAQLTAQIQLQQQALAQAQSVGERTILAGQLDALYAEKSQWQQGVYQPLQTISAIASHPAKRPVHWFNALVGALIGFLMALCIALVTVKP